MNPVVISLGGSLLYKDGKVDKPYLKQVCVAITRLWGKTKVVVVVGGGFLAKQYADEARRKHPGVGREFFADRAAITATRENAMLLVKALGSTAFPKVVVSPDQAAAALEKGKLPVSGGFLEGITTDACAVLIAERVGAKLVVNASRIDGIYDSDPNTNPSARRFSHLTHQQLVDLATRNDHRLARTNFVFDIVAAKLAARSRIPLAFVDGRDAGALERAVASGAAGTFVAA